MSRKGDTSGRTPGMMIAIFLLILAAYLTYIFLLHPWERKALLTQESNITINVVDCVSGYPINDARIIIYNEDGILLQELYTVNGQVIYRDYPDCFKIKASFDSDKFEGICVGSGEQKVVNFCYEYPEASPYVIHYEDELGVIGGTSGEEISSKEFENTILSFPVTNATVNYPEYFLYSNIFWSEGMGIQLTKINEELTKSINFEFKMADQRGTPKVKVIANGQSLFSEPVNTGELVKVSLPKQSINETINFEVKCDFDGWMFWSTQDCTLTDIKATQEFYTPRLTTQEFNFTASLAEREAETVELKFINTKESPGGVRASINGVQIFDSNSLLAKNYSASIPAAMLNLKPKGNKLVFNANPMAELWLRGIRLYFNSPVTETESKEVEFTVSDDDFESMDQAIINFFVENIYLNGTIKFKLNNVYYTATVEKAGWNKVIIDKKDLLKDNTLTLTAPIGRFEIGEFKITYE